MKFHENCLLADDSHEISYLIFFRKLEKTLQNLSSAAVVISGFWVKYVLASFWLLVAVLLTCFFLFVSQRLLISGLFSVISNNSYIHKCMWVCVKELIDQWTFVLQSTLTQEIDNLTFLVTS